MKELTHREVAARGGTNRWKGYTPEERKEEMKKVWSKRKKASIKRPKKFSTALIK